MSERKTRGEWTCTVGAVLVAATIVGFFAWYVTPHETEITVTGVRWERLISVERYETVTYAGWRLPSDARYITSYRKVRHYIGKHRIAVWDTWYVYEQEVWRHSRDVVTTGNKEVDMYWGDTDLSSETGAHGTGKERESGRTETLIVMDQDHRDHPTDRDTWGTAEVGKTMTVMLRPMDGHIELVRGNNA